LFENEKLRFLQQNSSNNKLRLDANYPSPGKIDTGNVLCHTTALETNKWSKGSSGPRDFTFWNNCFKLFKRQFLLRSVDRSLNSYFVKCNTDF
jgi:hypothetical protein